MDVFPKLIKLKGEDLFLRIQKQKEKGIKRSLLCYITKKKFLSSTTRDEYGDMFLFIL